MENLAQGYSLNKLLIALGNVREYIKNDKYKKEYVRKVFIIYYKNTIIALKNMINY